jgi:hypothetical protein
VAALQAAYPDAVVEVWAQDESRLGLKPIVRRVWSPKGVRPRAVGHHRYQWLYLSGLVQPGTGQTEWLLLPRVNTVAMQLALDEFARSSQVGSAKQVVLVLDNAGWHTSAQLVVPNGIHLLHLPAATPELQPAERLWPLVREALANETFASLDALEERLLRRCQMLSSMPAVIQSHTQFHWWPSSSCTL